MHAADVMTHNAITVDPAMPIQQLAALLSERGISGAPVVDATGNMIGIVSEGDLLHRAELGTERRHARRHSWWLEHCLWCGAGLCQIAWSHGEGHHDPGCGHSH